MKPIRHLLLAFLPAFLTLSTSAEPIDDFLFPPDLIVQAKDEVKLTEEQREHLRIATEKMETRFREVQDRLRKENDAFVELVKQPHVDVLAALKQLDMLLTAEREVKHTQIAFMLTVKNELTPEQQAKLSAFRKAQGLDRTAMEDFQRRIVRKAERVRLAVEKLAADSADIAPVAAIMEEVRTLMEQGKPKEAEAAIDRALKRLGEIK